MPNGFKISFFKNGDVKQTLPDTSSVYYYKSQNVTEMNLATGLTVYKFSNNQIEFIHDNGLIEVK